MTELDPTLFFLFAEAILLRIKKCEGNGFIVLAKRLNNTRDPYVTWWADYLHQTHAVEGKSALHCVSGHYYDSFAAAVADFNTRN